MEEEEEARVHSHLAAREPTFSAGPRDWPSQTHCPSAWGGGRCDARRGPWGELGSQTAGRIAWCHQTACLAVPACVCVHQIEHSSCWVEAVAAHSCSVLLARPSLRRLRPRAGGAAAKASSAVLHFAVGLWL